MCVSMLSEFPAISIEYTLINKGDNQNDLKLVILAKLSFFSY